MHTKRFAKSGHLTTHIRTHPPTGEKPCKREFCDQCFALLGNVIDHERAKHAEEFNALQAAFMERSTWEAAAQQEEPVPKRARLV